MAVVTAAADSVTLHVEGQQRPYTVATLPGKIALVIAAGGANPEIPKAKVFFAAFQAIDPGCDRAAARQLLDAAAAGGVPVDDLLPFCEAGALAIEREQVPDKQGVAAVDKWVEEKFAAEFLAAKTRPALRGPGGQASGRRRRRA